ncbi:prepilin peptidase [Alicyclobacillus vulcanalis]|uniref:Leader peptidase (Prepilin peptidase) / N-methyltransferase/leader peptidase (Prepilin peptidase) / N-methyltransferase n=1 Tax=Alicyclobacillus vulcanalis TaxID=252246 RepID=A0A1N7PHB2_9BACL|nr:A24 family peptidase [Alicyclobacillus vulcanalis]SIT10043.1 leader peptidase (prepilin peptidase) / N-methyltransferase/leader peptidase (prepilin peptidase) / N-methyltransferase [Alicyclobacillus vulcanalis]
MPQESLLREMLVILALFYGLIFGSFANVVGYRLPRGESVVWPGSHCPNCNRPLRAWELVPVLSWLALGGRCRTCKARISWRYPAIELATGAAFVLSAVTARDNLAQVGVWWAFWTYLASAVACDLTSLLLPNVLTLPAGLLFFLGSSLTGIRSWLLAATGAAVGYVIVAAIHLMTGGKMGMGDAKLNLAIGAMLGPGYMVMAFVLAAIYGVLAALPLRLAGRVKAQQLIPFAPFLALGAATCAFVGPDLWHLYADLTGL